MDHIHFDAITEQEKELVYLKASDENKQKDFFEKLRTRVKDFVSEHPKAAHIKYIMLIPDCFQLICKLFADPRVPTDKKVYLGIAIAYCVSPIDILADFIPGGFTDDILIMMKTLSDLINSVDHTIICEHWFGEENAIKVITDLTKMVSENLNKEKIAAKVAAFFDSLKKNNRG